MTSDQNNHRKLKRSYTHLENYKFKDEPSKIDWTTVLNNRKNNVTRSLEDFRKLLDKYAAIKQKIKKEMKANTKHWLTTGVLTFIRNKNKIYSKFCKSKNKSRKETLHQ